MAVEGVGTSGLSEEEGVVGTREGWGSLGLKGGVAVEGSMKDDGAEAMLRPN